MIYSEEEVLVKHQKIAYEALKEIECILKDNNIPYFLLAGSVLGAVRHKGFIPWDDDIDIGIFLKDKEKVSFLLEEKLSSKFQWIDRRINPSYPRFFGKVLYDSKSCVDVFVLVKTSDDKKERKRQWNRRKLLYKLYKAKLGYVHSREKKNYKEVLKVLVAKICANFISVDRILEWIKVNESQFENLNDNRFYLNMYSVYSLEKELINTEWLVKPQYILFNDGYFPTVNNTDAYLTKLYGDYMILPPEDKRVPCHDEIFHIGVTKK